MAGGVMAPMRAAASVSAALLAVILLLACQTAPEPVGPPAALPTASPIPTVAPLAAVTLLPTATRQPTATSLTPATPLPAATDLPTATPLAIATPLPAATTLPTVTLAPMSPAVAPTDGPIRVEAMPSRVHFPNQLRIGDVILGGYDTVPPTSGPHWNAWSDCGFYNYPLPDELLVHNLEHGNIIVSYNLTDETDITALREAVDAIPLAAEYAIVRRYLDIPEGMVALTTWGVLDRMVGVDPERIAAFFAAYPGNTGPEFANGLPCTTGIQMTESSGG